MKRLLLSLLFVLTMAGIASAAPFLTCDCSVDAQAITGAKLQFGAQEWIVVPVVSSCGTIAPITCTGNSRVICYDLAGLPGGNFTVKGRFTNAWGESGDSLPFEDTKVLPSVPGTIRIVQ